MVDYSMWHVLLTGSSRNGQAFPSGWFRQASQEVHLAGTSGFFFQNRARSGCRRNGRENANYSIFVVFSNSRRSAGLRFMPTRMTGTPVSSAMVAA